MKTNAFYQTKMKLIFFGRFQDGIRDHLIQKWNVVGFDESERFSFVAEFAGGQKVLVPQRFGPVECQLSPSQGSVEFNRSSKLPVFDYDVFGVDGRCHGNFVAIGVLQVVDGE